MVSKPFVVRCLNDSHVNSAHLLSNHNNTRCLRSTADARNGKQLNEAREEIVSLCQSGILDHALLLIKLCLDVVDVSCCLQRRIAKSQQRLVSVVRLLLLEVPSGGLRAEVDANHCTRETYLVSDPFQTRRQVVPSISLTQRNRRNERGSKLQPPSDLANLVNSKVC